MADSRRGFFKRLLAIGVGVAAAPVVAKAAEPLLSWDIETTSSPFCHLYGSGYLVTTKEVKERYEDLLRAENSFWRAQPITQLQGRTFEVPLHCKRG